MSYMAIASTISQGVTGGIAAIRNKRTAAKQNQLFERQEELADKEDAFNRGLDERSFQATQQQSAFNRGLAKKQDALAKEDLQLTRDDMRQQARGGFFNRAGAARSNRLDTAQRKLSRL
jgi:hypothetical protein